MGSLTQSRLLSDEQFSSAVHDLRNPICSILNLTEVLLSTPFRSLEEKEFCQAVDLIRKLAQKMRALTEELAPESKMRIAANRSTLTAYSLLTEAATLWRPLAGQKKIAIKIGSSASETQICCDTELIGRVFSNLIGNAIRYSPLGSPILLCAEDITGAVLFKVRDFGPGIPSGQLRLVFQRYWQAEPGKSAGLGLGLAISLGFVADHGGKIWAEHPQQGAGSVFCFTLPT